MGPGAWTSPRPALLSLSQLRAPLSSRHLGVPGVLLFHQASSSTQIHVFITASEADITNQSQIPCSMDPEADFLARSSRWLLPLGQKQHSDLPTLIAMGKDCLATSSCQGQGRPALEGFWAPDRIHIVLEA